MSIAALMVGAVSVAAQEPSVGGGVPVSGRVTIVEKPGGIAGDVGSTVIFLDFGSPGKGSAEATNAQIVLQSKQFVPRVRIVTVGSRVDFPNQDPFRHNVFSNTPGGTFDLGLYPRGVARGTSFRRAGVYPIFCNIHSRMTGFIVAVTTPYYTQAQADGAWAIPNVPAGTYALHVWHERAPEVVRELVVGGEPVAGLDAQLDARGWRPPAHKNKFGKDYPPIERDRY